MLKTVLKWIYPRKCMFCATLLNIKNESFICEDCGEIILFNEKPSCIKCGRHVENDFVICSECNHKNFYFERNYAVLPYDDMMKHLMHELKYRKHSEYVEGIFLLIKDKIDLNFFKEVECLVPIPLHKARKRERGFNQSEKIAAELSKITKIPVEDNLIKRIRKTKPQFGLNAIARENNLKGAFAIHEKNAPQYKNIVLVDDIYTTGSTINECGRVLLAHGVEAVSSFTLSITYRQ